MKQTEQESAGPVWILRGYDQIALGHLPAVRQVHAGEVDCCIGIEAGARALGLDFIALDRKPYHLVIRRKDLELPAVKALLETLGRASFRFIRFG